MIHIKQDGTNEKTIIMLHGTGGTERDLIAIAQYIDPQATLIGIRGNVEENGMARFFARYKDGSYDLRSLARETYELHRTIQELVDRYKLDPTQLTIMGYSNGANITLNMMQEFELTYKQYLLFHATGARQDVPFMASRSKAFLSFGENDPYISDADFTHLSQAMAASGTSVTEFKQNVGHELIEDEVKAAKAFYDQN